MPKAWFCGTPITRRHLEKIRAGVAKGGQRDTDESPSRRQEGKRMSENRQSRVLLRGREKNVKEQDDERVGAARGMEKREGGGTNKWKVGVTHRGISVPW